MSTSYHAGWRGDRCTLFLIALGGQRAAPVPPVGSGVVVLVESRAALRAHRCFAAICSWCIPLGLLVDGVVVVRRRP